MDEVGKTTLLGLDQSKVIWEHLKSEGYINAGGKIQEPLKKALKDGTFTVPEAYAAQLPQIKEVLHKLAGKLEIKNADDRIQVRTRRAVLESEDFKSLWNRIKHKTTYRVAFDNEKLIDSCIKSIRNAPPVAATRLQWRKADLAIGRAGVETHLAKESMPVYLAENDVPLPDLLTDLQDKTQLTRRTIVRILTESGRLNDFTRNPQQFIELVGKAINRAKRLAIVDGIKYQRLGDDYYYAQELFEQEELTGYLKNTLTDMQKSVFQHVVYDSDTEANFATQMENNEAVKVYAKLPGWFKVPTPLGTYNPDWAVLVERNGTERLYFVVETKSSLFTDDLRDRESAKITCGEAHFKAMESGDDPARFVKASTLEDVFAST